MYSIKDIKKYGSASKDFCYENDIIYLEGEFKLFSEEKNIKKLKDLLDRAENLHKSKGNTYGFQNTGLTMKLIELKGIIKRKIEELEENQ